MLDRLYGNHRETAQLLGFSEQALWKAVNERGCPVHERLGPGKATVYYWPAVVEWRIADKQPVDLDRARARLAEAQADKAELDMSERRADLLPAADLERAWSHVVMVMRAHLLMGPTSLGPQLLHQTDPNAIADAIRTWLYGALDHLAEWAPPARSEGGASGDGDVPAAPATDGEPVGGPGAEA